MKTDQKTIESNRVMKGIEVAPGLIYFGGTFYHVRKGAVKYVPARDQDGLRRRHHMILNMLNAPKVAPPAATVQVIKPIGRGGVADFRRFAAKNAPPPSLKIA